MARKPRQRKPYRYRTNTQDLEWSEERADDATVSQNIGEGQRLLSAVAGAGLLGAAWPKRSWLGVVLATAGISLLYRAASGYCPAFGALGIDLSGHNHNTNRLGRKKLRSEQATKVVRTIEINRPPSELYHFWRSLENLPRVMSHLESVEVITDRLSHWVVKTRTGVPTVEWDAEIIRSSMKSRMNASGGGPCMVPT
jgi:uncharacterized membrane protein